jgi:hypothetical protein
MLYRHPPWCRQVSTAAIALITHRETPDARRAIRFFSEFFWTDEPPNVSRLDPSGAVQFDADHPAEDRKVGGSIPSLPTRNAAWLAIRSTKGRAILILDRDQL